MGMFLNYHDIANNYSPNNLICAFPKAQSYTKLAPVQASKPYEEYDSKGNLIGYFWRYGETLNLEFNIEGEIAVESDAIVYLDSGDGPCVNTPGYVNQRAYNITDLRSWTCTKVVKDTYVWDEDSEFIYDETAGTKVYVSAEEFLLDKYVDVILYNFRLEPIYSKTYEATSKIILSIDKELSLNLKKGIYYCELHVFNENVNMKIFGSHDCTLMVK